jgi:ribonuclease-3
MRTEKKEPILMKSKSAEDILQYRFSDKELLEKALTHSSFANEMTGDPANGNERLEFLGDAVLDAVISVYLFEKYKEKAEGELTRLRALIVCEKSLSAAGKAAGVNALIRLGRGEEMGGGRQRSSIVADAVEAVIGAVYLDGGMAAAEAVVLHLLSAAIGEALSGTLFMDHKTELQEWLQHQGNGEPYYRILSEEGPDHAKIFTASVNAGKLRLGVGSGHNKKEAEQEAARNALETIGTKR